MTKFITKNIKMDSLKGWTTNNLVLHIWRNTKVHYDDIIPYYTIFIDNREIQTVNKYNKLKSGDKSESL